MDGLEALPRIKAACPDGQGRGLSGFEAGAMQERSMRAGADAYLQKGTPPKEILATRPLAPRPRRRTDGRRADRPPPGGGADGGRRTGTALRRRPSAPRTRRPWGLLVVSGAADAADGNGDGGLRQRRGPVAAGTRRASARVGPGRRVAGRPLAAVGALLRRSLRGDLAGGVHDRMIGGGPWDVSVRADGPDLVVSLHAVAHRRGGQPAAAGHPHHGPRDPQPGQPLQRRRQRGGRGRQPA